MYVYIMGLLVYINAKYIITSENRKREREIAVFYRHANIGLNLAHFHRDVTI